MHAVANNSNLLLWVSLCYATLWHKHNQRRRRQNNAETATIFVLSYYYLAPVGKCYLKHTMTYAAVWLSFYVFIFAILTYLTTVNQCLTIFFVQKLCAIGKIFIRWSEKKHQIIEKVDMSKMPPVNPLF